MGPLQPDGSLRLLAIAVIAMVAATVAWYLGIVSLGILMWVGGVLIGVAGLYVLTHGDRASALRFAIFALAMLLMFVAFLRGPEFFHIFNRPVWGGFFLNFTN